ncbi:MAG: L-ribulose-5-phosphate 4-epimerase AraD [Kiritimatiellaeota bacterium]|nr:L-ribulose-5-phosphate 4-epimerase AraD [Kiritimatiellota bacterium]
MNLYDDLREEAYSANMEIERNGLAIQTFGNASAYDSDRAVFAIKPSGVPYRDLRVSDMVVVDLDSKVVVGTLSPSSDTKTHAVLYKAFSGIGGIVHTHSTYAVAWCQARRAIPIYGTTHADHLQVDVPCSEVMSDEMIRGNYEEETGNQIVETFADISPMEACMVLVAAHGPFTWGKTAAEAVYNSVVVEELAKIAILTERINPDSPRLEPSLIEKHYQRKHGGRAYYGQKN